MQRRPLHQVVVRHDYPHPIYAHCLTGIKTPEPRLTITSHPTGRTQRNRWLWYLGGRLATSGVDRTQADQIAHARDELKVCIPWVDLDKAEFSTLRVDRAEPAQHRLLKPDNAYAKRVGQVLVCWPTKLSLAPDLGDRVLAQLPPPAYSDSVDIDLPRPPPATPPWV